MMRKWEITILLIGLVVSSCRSNDDDGDLPQTEQNQVDDQAISQYLDDHYFDPERGLITKFEGSEENYPSLKSLGIKLPSGVWVIKRPDVEAEGPAIANNKTDSILISFNSSRFKASYEDLEEGQKPYERYTGLFYNTIYSTGTPAWDPIFYYHHINQNENSNIDLSYYVIEGFVEGLKHFNSTQTNGTDIYNFQGAILVPSRAAYGRDFVYLNGILDNTTYRDQSFVFNFELHKVIPKNTN